MGEKTRIILFLLISVALVSLWELVIPQKHEGQSGISSSKIEKVDTSNDIQGAISQPDSKTKGNDTPNHLIDRDMSNNKRVKLENNKLIGSINLVGAEIDDISTKNFHNKNGEMVRILSPDGCNLDIHKCSVGFISKKNNTNIPSDFLPTKDTTWSVVSKTENSAIIEWKNNYNTKFRLELKLDDEYMINIQHSVHYIGKGNLQDIKDIEKSYDIRAYALLYKYSSTYKEIMKTLNENFSSIYVFDKSIKRINHDKNEKQDIESVSWAGIDSKYWLAALVPNSDNSKHNKIYITHKIDCDDISGQIIMVSQNRMELTPQNDISSNNIQKEFNLGIFIGPKQYNVLKLYEKRNNIEKLHMALDFGFLYIVEMPMYLMLRYINNIFHNYGFSIIVLTCVIKLLLSPLSYISLKNSKKLNQLSPEINKLKVIYEDNKREFHSKIMALYKKHKVSPLKSILALIIQLPFFIGVYKLLSILIELRHAPFLWKITDLSQKDTTNILTLLGYLDIEFLKKINIGVLPVIMCITLYIQQISQKYSTMQSETNEVAMKAMKFIPLFMLFVSMSLPSGLLIYWITSNIISIVHQLIFNNKMERK